MEIIFYPTASSFASEKPEEIVHVKTVQNSTQNSSLANTVTKTEDIGRRAIPSNISYLVYVDEYQNPYKDHRKSSWY